jgi:DsbC/DsbD-like thiol-disulfide interchange protein
MTIRTATFALASIALAAVANAQTPTPVHWTATAVSKSAAPGVKTELALAAQIDEGWHIYSLTQGPGGPFPSKITIPSGQLFTLAGPIKASAPDVKFDDAFGINVETYEKKADFKLPITVSKKAKAGSQKVNVAVRYQVCNSNMCLPPHTDKVAANIDVHVKSNGNQ